MQYLEWCINKEHRFATMVRYVYWEKEVLVKVRDIVVDFSKLISKENK